MARRKRHWIRRIALGLAVAALASPATAQSRPLDVSGDDARSIHLMSVRSEDLALSRSDAATPPVEHGRDGYDAGLGSLWGLVLILTATGAAVAVHHTRKGTLTAA
jgi:hypothetical protein